MNLLFEEQAKRYSIILGPHLSEKASKAADHARQIVFKVDVSANKLKIKEAVEFIFSVKVAQIRLLNMKGKVKRFKQTVGRRNHWKKAYVSLKEGYSIDFNQD